MGLQFCSYLVFLLTVCCLVETKPNRNCQRQRRKGRCQSVSLLTKSYGSIQSPGYPRNYSNNLQRDWRIRVPKGYRIRMRFRKDFDVEDSAMCQKDALIVSFDKNFKNTRLLCGTLRGRGQRGGRGVTSPSNELWIKFRTDDSGVGKGFTANYRSIDVNECRKEVCRFPSLCRNTVGSYMCDCPDGYKLRGRKNSGRCVDINECSSGMAKCDFRCVNTQGSYHCVCPAGYKLAYNERSCRDINECARGNGGCSHQCRNSRGSYSCYCPPGYKLDAKKKSCHKEIFYDSYQKISFVNEDAPIGTLITRVKAKLAKHPGHKLVFSIVAENLKAAKDNPTFIMDAASGEIRVRAPLDREKTSEYLLEIEAKYKNTSASKRTVKARSFLVVRVLDVNDNPPRFSHQSYTITVPCNVRPGSVLYRLDTYDPDEDKNAQVTYKLEPKNRYFTVQKHSGKIKVLRSLRGFCDDSTRGTFKRFEYKVVATDRGSPALTTRVRLRFIIAAIDVSSQTMFVWYSEGADFHVRKKKPSRKFGGDKSRK